MRTSKNVMLMAGLALCLVGCQTQQDIAKNKTAATEWLGSQKSGARIDISGTWFSQEWGKATLKQSGREVTGTLDTYEVKGVVSGGKAYLTTWDSGKCYYAVVLSQTSKNVLSGSYTDGPTYKTDTEQQRTVELRRSY